MSVVAAEGLRKEFTVWAKAGRFRRRRRTVAAVDGVDLRIEPGEIGRASCRERV